MSADVTSRLVQLLEPFPEGVVQFLVNLKGLSHKIDFKILKIFYRTWPN